jgi:mono/diheme cytochrome c family protein
MPIESSKNPMHRPLLAICLIAVLHGGSAAELKLVEGYIPRPEGSLTFAKEIAPIIFRNCSSCHRPDQSSPFDLLSYVDAKRHSETIARVVGERYMPPWPPERGFGDFAGERRLTVEQIGMIQQWVAEGTAEGAPEHLPPDPVIHNRWELGPPDMVVPVPEGYALTAAGPDLYRNLVIPLEQTEDRYVRAIELRPGSRAVHHASFFVDESKASRIRDFAEVGGGFSGMDMPEGARSPQGQLLGWEPGQGACRSFPGFEWILPKGGDIVLQLHLNPTGKPETINPEVGLYFTSVAPTNAFFKLLLTSTTIDIPPGERNYLLEDSYRLPVDATVYGVYPHAHFLCRRMEAWATLPDGSRKWILLIKSWDFFWQFNYTLKEPLHLPKGTELAIRYTYDNSESNPVNPNQPPRRVRFGAASSDEMGEFWLQVLASESDQAILAVDFERKTQTNTLNTLQYRLRIDPGDLGAHVNLATLQWRRGETNIAIEHYREASRLDPQYDLPHYCLGRIHLERNNLTQARSELEQAAALNSKSHETYQSLAIVAGREGKLEESVEHLRRVLALKPGDRWATNALEFLSKKQLSQPVQPPK